MIVNDVINYLNANQPVLLAIAGLVAVLLHYAVDHIAGFGKLTNKVLGLVAIPGLLTAGAALLTTIHAYQYPIVAIIGQLIYAVNEAYRARVIAKSELSSTEVSNPLLATEAHIAAPTQTEY